MLTKPASRKLTISPSPDQEAPPSPKKINSMTRATASATPSLVERLTDSMTMNALVKILAYTLNLLVTPMKISTKESQPRLREPSVILSLTPSIDASLLP
jgi:hypothetical protein